MARSWCTSIVPKCARCPSVRDSRSPRVRVRGSFQSSKVDWASPARAISAGWCVDRGRGSTRRGEMRADRSRGPAWPRVPPQPGPTSALFDQRCTRRVGDHCGSTERGFRVHRWPLSLLGVVRMGSAYSSTTRRRGPRWHARARRQPPAMTTGRAEEARIVSGLAPRSGSGGYGFAARRGATRVHRFGSGGTQPEVGIATSVGRGAGRWSSDGMPSG